MCVRASGLMQYTTTVAAADARPSSRTCVNVSFFFYDKHDHRDYYCANLRIACEATTPPPSRLVNATLLAPAGHVLSARHLFLGVLLGGGETRMHTTLMKCKHGLIIHNGQRTTLSIFKPPAFSSRRSQSDGQFDTQSHRPDCPAVLAAHLDSCTDVPTGRHLNTISHPAPAPRRRSHCTNPKWSGLDWLHRQRQHCFTGRCHLDIIILPIICGRQGETFAGCYRVCKR